MKFNYILRTRVIYFFILAASLVLIGKLFLIQIVHSESFKSQADRQYYSPAEKIYERGTIYFTRKDGQLVSSALQTSGYKLVINPSKLLNIDDTLAKLKSVVALDEEEFILKAQKINDPHEEIAQQLTKEEADKISALKIAGVSLRDQKWRFYPGGKLASQTLGFVAFKENDLEGRYGLERQYNNELSRDKDNPYVNFFAEVFSNINDTIFSDQPKRGDIVTSIEPEVQSFLEKTLETTKEKYSIDTIGGIIMHPQTGAIYALSTKPDFDPNNFSKVKNVATFSNPLVENVFEFGSVVKPLVMAGGLQEGVVTAATTYDDRGSVWIEDKEIFNFDKKGRGVVSMQEVLGQSLNTGMVFVEQKLGKVKFLEYLLSFGIKEKTGIDLPNETSALMSNLIKSPRELEYANAAFGQGIAFTPIELVRALASLGNDGKLVVPHIATKIKYNSGIEKEIKYEMKDTMIGKEVSEEITRMLVNIMDKSIEGGARKLEHYSIAVKTGTAQIANTEGGGYYVGRNMHSFFGYFPAYDPQFIVFLYAVNPKGVPYALQTWISPFMDITKFLINYYEVPPDR